MIAETLHRKIYRLIKTMIVTKFDPFEKLPSERSLSLDFGVSRNTIRTAMNELYTNHYVFRVQGLGTFVAERPSISDENGGFTDLANAILEANTPFKKQMNSFDLVYDTEAINRLKLETSEKVLSIEQSYIADEGPILITRSYFPAKTVPTLVKPNVYQVTTIKNLFRNSRSVAVASIEKTVSARLATQKEAQLLRTDEPTVVIEADEVKLDYDGAGIMYSKAVANADHFVYRSRQVF
ncbi:GntR family transcriptional regulator [Lacticaseibacillus paracasei]|uniref:GntR family transcriptional regulator n=1 Tax=Lacticaseibacillus paracasei TaxID=1597 RepID=UPI0007BFB541|nr:GntR family transcriptional regulator [Lacticaseibacillus paracasei]URW91786.1 GntR family transcriptional regulator [Lacticaseibacillus paracasei]